MLSGVCEPCPGNDVGSVYPGASSTWASSGWRTAVFIGDAQNFIGNLTCVPWGAGALCRRGRRAALPLTKNLSARVRLVVCLLDLINEVWMAESCVQSCVTTWSEEVNLFLPKVFFYFSLS